MIIKGEYIFTMILILYISAICFCIYLLLKTRPKVVNVKETIASVKIIDSYYRAAYSTPMRIGKVTTFTHNPAIYHIHVDYNGINYIISGFETYNAYKDRIGEIVDAIVETRTFSNGSVSYDILSIKDQL